MGKERGNDMTELVKLGRTDLLIHPIGLGANKIAAADPKRTPNMAAMCF